jgi:hypothetical protein
MTDALASRYETIAAALPLRLQRRRQGIDLRRSATARESPDFNPDWNRAERVQIVNGGGIPAIHAPVGMAG